MNWDQIDFARAGELTTSPETVGAIIGLLTATKGERDGLVDLEALAMLGSEPERAIAAIQFLAGVTLAALDDMEKRDGLNVDSWLQRMALHYQ